MSTIKEARSRYRDDGDELEPIFTGHEDDPDDFSTLTYDQAIGHVDKMLEIGVTRKKQLNGVLKQDSSGDYVIPNTCGDADADFTDRANYEYLNGKYPWLHKIGGNRLGIEDSEATTSHESLEKFMASIPHEDWQAFITDVGGMEDYYSLDDDRASELEMEEQGRWMTEDGCPDLIKAMVENRDDSYEAYLLGKATDSMVWEWCRETDNYPESQDGNSCWMDMDKLGAEEETQDWFLEQIDDDVAGWTEIKRDFYEADEGKVAKQFDLAIRELATENEAVATTYHRLTTGDLWDMFLLSFPDERREDGDPYWYQWQPDWSKPKEWKAGFEPEKQDHSHWQHGFKQALEYLKGVPWFVRLVGNWFNRGPEGHPEFKFEQLLREARDRENPDDPEMFMRYGGGLAEEKVYEDDKIEVMYPRNFETLNYHLRMAGEQEIDRSKWEMLFRHRDIFVFLGKDRPDLLGREGKRELGVVYGNGSGGELLHVFGRGDIQSMFKDPVYGRNVRLYLLRYYRDIASRDPNAAHTLMQMGGPKELRRAERKGHIDTAEFSLALGLHYIKRHKYKLAAKAFRRPLWTVTTKGVWLIFDAVEDLIPCFKNEDAAGTVFAHDHHDWFDHYWEKQNRPEVKDVVPFLSKDAIAHIRKVMVNRRVWFPDGGPDEQGEHIVLTKKLIAAYDDDTIMGWLENPSDEDQEEGVFDDVIEAIQLAGVDILSSASQDEVYTGYIKAAVDAIDGTQHKWGTSKTKKTASGPMETFEVFVPWRAVESWISDYADNNGGSYDGALEDLATSVNHDKADPDVNNMEAGWHDVKKEWAWENLHRIFELEIPEFPEDPKQVTLPLGEAIDDPEAMPNMLSGIPVEFEKQVKAILRDSCVMHNYHVSDLTIKFEPALLHSEEDIDASDGRLANMRGAHMHLIVTYLKEPEPDYGVNFTAYNAIRAAAVNLFKNYDLIDGFNFNPLACGMPENMTIFQFNLSWSTPRQQPEPGEIPF